MSKKITDMTEKVTIDDNDYFEIIDSVELVESLRNKKVKGSTVKAYTQSSGTWTVASPVGEPTLTSTFGRYVKTGISVLLEFQFTVPANADASEMKIDNIPYSPVSSPLSVGSIIAVDGGTGDNIELHNLQTNNTDQLEFKSVSGTVDQSWTWTQAAGKFVKGSITYITDEF